MSDATKKNLYEMADVAICLSDTLQETFGVSVLEAMAAGLPVVAPDWNGYRDIVLDGRTGFLIDTAVVVDNGLLNAMSMLIDPAFALGQRVVIDLEALIGSLVGLSRNRAQARQMGESGRQRAQEYFSWQAVVRRLEDLWSEQIETGKTIRGKQTTGAIGYLDYDKVFAGHPSSWLDEETRIRPSRAERDYVRRGFDGSLFSPPPLAGFSQEINRDIFAFVHESGETTVSELMKHVQSQHCGPSMVTTHLGRLLKYGLLSYVPASEVESLEKETSHESLADCALSPIGI
jgi:hypothetical protein